MKKILLLFLSCSIAVDTSGQYNQLEHSKVYKLNKKTEGPVLIGLWVLNFYGMYQLGQKPALDTAQVEALNKDDVWAFDRVVFNQSYPAPANIYTISDIGLWVSFLSPALLFLDKNISKDWKDITMLYFESQAINYNIYVWSATFTKRIRPIVYYDEDSNNFRFEKTTTDSFFSGHASMTAGASFFIAKVLNDYHPEWGSKRSLLFVAAVIPPVLVGYWRYRGLLHFPTDIIIGTAVGATIGILTPHFHKITRKMKVKNEMSFVPFSGKYSGTGLHLSARF